MSLGFKIVGIDLAGAEHRPSGVCVLVGWRAITDLLYSDAELVELIEREMPAIVAIDAPLSLPLGRRDLSMPGPHLRQCDRELLRMRIKFFPVSLGPMRELTKRGIKLRCVLEKLGLRVIEVYPGGAQDLWHLPRAHQDKEKLLKGLRGFGIRGLRANSSVHELDAATAALVGKLYAERRYIAIGNEVEGQIILPLI